MNIMVNIGLAVLELYDAIADARDAYNKKVDENYKQLIRGSVLDPMNHPSKN